MRKIVLMAALASASPTHASDLYIAYEEFHKSEHPFESSTISADIPTNYVDVWVHWKNAWNNSRNHDAIWLFVKIRGVEEDGTERVRHADIGGTPTILAVGDDTGSPSLSIAPLSDNHGVFLHPDRTYRGDVRAKVRLPLSQEAFDGLGVEGLRVTTFGIEMVRIPQSAFHIGANSELATEYGAYFRSSGDGVFGGSFEVTSEDAIEVGPVEGQLYYDSSAAPQFMGDMSGPIPTEYPKGFDAFYVMKYEISQGQYATFLNNIDLYAPQLRLNFGGKDYYESRGTIVQEGDIAVATNPDRPANFISWEDGIAYLDWAALRPMTDFEFSKASRGPDKPVPGDYVWGTDDDSNIQRVVLPDGDIGMLNGWTEAELTDATKDVFGASYYWVMDLSGSLWERVVASTDTEGRQFNGEHGDGRISAYGEANQSSWPRELGSPRRGKGFGYRGGGYYDVGGAYDLFRPHSRVAYRPFGNWSGGPRHRAYGMRGVRTASN